MMNRQGVLISVIVPVYNVAPYLPRCLDSILAQTYPHLEIILVDDGSTDDSGAICDAYAQRDPRIKVFHQTNHGVGWTRNFGLQKAAGDYMAFIDADDTVEPEYLATLLAVLQAYTADMAICGALRHLADGTTQTWATKEQYAAEPEEIIAKILYGDKIVTVTPWAKLFKRGIFDAIQFPALNNHEDVMVMCQMIAQARRIGVNSLPLYHYYEREDSLSAAKPQQLSLAEIKAHQVMCTFVAQTYPALQLPSASRLMKEYLKTLKIYLNHRPRDRATEKSLWRYIKTNRRAVKRSPYLTRRERLVLRTTYLGFPLYCLVRHCSRLLRRVFRIKPKADW